MREASDLARRSRKTIYKWIKIGVLPVLVGEDGVKRVWGMHVLKAKAEMMPGRAPSCDEG